MDDATFFGHALSMSSVSSVEIDKARQQEWRRRSAPAEADDVPERLVVAWETSMIIQPVHLWTTSCRTRSAAERPAPDRPRRRPSRCAPVGERHEPDALAG